MRREQYIAELCDGVIRVQRVDALPACEERVMTVAITGAGLPHELAQAAARAHFDLNPERVRVFIATLTGALDGWLE